MTYTQDYTRRKRIANLCIRGCGETTIKFDICLKCRIKRRLYARSNKDSNRKKLRICA